MSDMPKVYVAATGMVTPLGADTATTAAALKAGISAYQDSDFALPSYEYVRMALVPEELLKNSLTPNRKLRRLNAHQLRLLQLANIAVRQVQSRLLPDLDIPIIIAGPEPLPGDESPITKRWLEHLAMQSGIRINSSLSRFIAGGRAGGLGAIRLAFRLFESTPATLALVIGVDSYYDGTTIRNLLAEKRLLAGNNKDGFIPGEGAGVLLLSKQAVLFHKEARRTVCLFEPGIGSEAGHRYSEEPYRGEGLAAALTNALGNAGTGKIHSLYSSMNGENFFAKEHGVAVIRNGESFEENITTEHPADCFGDLGAAFASVVTGINAMYLSTAPQNAPSLVCCSSDREARGAMVMQS